jgi:hypothetical protein
VEKRVTGEIRHFSSLKTERERERGEKMGEVVRNIIFRGQEPFSFCLPF